MPPAVSNRPSKAGPGNDAPAQQVFPTRWRAVLALTVLFAVALAGPSRAEHASLPTGIAALAAAGISEDDIVRLSQLIAFVNYQVRLVTGLRLMEDLS